MNSVKKVPISRKKRQSVCHGGGPSPEFFHDFKWWDYLILALIFAFCIGFIYPTGDLWNTGYSSLAYLQGHFSDFYDYNAKIFGGSDYYPFLYLLFAVWNIPLKLMGIRYFDYSSNWVMIYEKVFPSLMQLLTAIPVYLIVRKLGHNIRVAVYAAFLFVTSSTMLIATMCWGMYDIVFVFFITFGFYFFIRDAYKADMLISMLVFGLGIATKAYSAILLLPLLAYRFKNIFKMGGYGLISLLPILFSRFIYRNSPAFTKEAANASDFSIRLFTPFLDYDYFKISLFCLAYIVLCLVLYSVRYDREHPIKLLYVTILAGTVFYSLVCWNPQWLTLIMPFLAILTAVSTKRATYILYDMALGVFYILHSMSLWPQFSGNLISVSIWGKYLRSDPSAVYITRVFPTKYAIVYTSAVVALLIAHCIVKNPFRDALQYEGDITVTSRDKLYYYARLLLPVGFYVGSMFLWFLRNLQH